MGGRGRGAWGGVGRERKGGGGGRGGARITARSHPFSPLPTPPPSRPRLQGGHVLVGAPTGAWQLILITRGKACPVSRNYLAAVEGAVADLDALGVEVLALTADGRDSAAGFVADVKAAAAGGAGAGGVSGAGGDGSAELGMKVAYGLGPDQAGAWGFYLSEGPTMAGLGGGGGWAGASPAAAPPPAIHPEPGVILLTPDGAVSLVLKSSSAFGWADLRILVEGIRFMQEKGYPIRGTYSLE